MFDPKTVANTQAKPLPILFLLDVSGSMMGDKIAILNQAVEAMIKSLVDEEKMERQILMSVVTFGGEVTLHLPFTRVSQIMWESLSASGGTPLGEALRKAKALIEEGDGLPKLFYRPTVILVTDGQPTDDWQGYLKAFISEGRSAKCFRMGMAIGRDADEAMIKQFINNPEEQVFRAEDANDIPQFFQRVTMSVSMRAQSKDPNQVPSSSVTKQAMTQNIEQKTFTEVLSTAKNQSSQSYGEF